MILRYDRRAIADIEAIHDYIAADNPRAAHGVIARVERAVGRLLVAPLSGRPGIVAGTRLLVVPGLPYVAVYRVRGDRIDVLAVLHTARNRRR